MRKESTSPPTSQASRDDSARRKRGWGIRGQLVLGFTSFVIVVLVIVLIFQVFLLDYFFQEAKKTELSAVHSSIEYSIGKEDFDEICAELASAHDICICIYRIENGDIGDLYISKEVSPTCVIHYADKDTLNAFYDKAMQNDGYFTQPFTLGRGDGVEGNRRPSGEISEGDGAFESKVKAPPNPDKPQRAMVVAVSVKAIRDHDGNEFVVFTNIGFSPMPAVEITRIQQYIYIAIALVISTIILALLISKRIAKPLEKITRSAERFAAGDYSVQFDVEGYAEMRRLAETLNYAAEEVSKTDKLKQELIANVSHDLRTPLTLITGYAEMMRDIPGENTPENTQVIIDEATRLTTLVNDLLDVSRYSDHRELKPTRFNLTDIVRKTINRYTELVKHDGFVIVFEESEDAVVEADESMILQVLYNLTNNAINYTGPDKRVVINQSIIDGKTVRITITDTGEGISQEDIPYIWDRYYKVDKTHRRSLSGSGLGLSIVKNILVAHNSSFGVESTPSKGSSFWFELPIVD